MSRDQEMAQGLPQLSQCAMHAAVLMVLLLFGIQACACVQGTGFSHRVSCSWVVSSHAYCITAPPLPLQSACEHGCQLPGHIRCRHDSSLAVHCVCDYSRLLQSREVSVL